MSKKDDSRCTQGSFISKMITAISEFVHCPVLQKTQKYTIFGNCMFPSLQPQSQTNVIQFSLVYQYFNINVHLFL
jgi:hypothetical protein